MSTLFPPLESGTSVHSIQTATTPTATAAVATNEFPMPSSLGQRHDFPEDGDNDADEDVLSPELTHNFGVLRSLLATPEPDESSTPTVDENSSTINKRKKADSLAIETAILVEREVAHLQNGIRELEALLAAQQSQQTVQNHQRRRNRRRIDATDVPLPQQPRVRAGDGSEEISNHVD